MASIDKFKEDRLEKLKKIRAIGWNPYPSSYDKKNTVKESLESEGKTVKTAGRLFSFRTHGNIAFADIKDESGKIQLFFKKAVLGAEAFKNLDLLDIGDFVGVEGEVGKTIAGEISIIPNTYTLLTKSILPLPNSWYGLKDIEDRFRKRYLDLILNPEVKNRIGIRSKIIQSIRNFLEANNFIEIETPTLQPIYGGGFAKPFKTHFNALDADFYLRISDEMYLKRLIVGGFEKVYEITKVFRNEGYDSDHNPEFTMFEAQIAYQDYYYGMDIIEKIIEHVSLQVHGSTEFEYQGTQMTVKSPWPRYRVVEAIKKYTYEDPLLWKTIEEAKKKAISLITNEEKHEEIERINSIGEIIALLFEECVESKLLQPTIIYDYPVEVSPLAKKCEDPRFTQRFEMFAFGSELGNNYSELNDPIDLRKRFVDEKKRENAGFEDAHQTDYDYIEAIEHGFPLTCGIAIGIDRLVMLLTNATNIKEVIPFPTLRPIQNNSEQKTQLPPAVEKTEKKAQVITNLTLTREKALKLLNDKVKNKNLVKHCIAVEAAMKALAQKFEGDAHKWGMAGLLHDGDWEVTQNDHARHAIQVVEWIKELGEQDPELLKTILVHNHHHNGENKPSTSMEWALYTCDELTGLIVATTLVMPSRKIKDVTVESVLKKFPAKSFAAGVNRDQIKMCETELNIPISEFVDIVLKSMQSIAQNLGL